MYANDDEMKDEALVMLPEIRISMTKSFRLAGTDKNHQAMLQQVLFWWLAMVCINEGNLDEAARVTEQAFDQISSPDNSFFALANWIVRSWVYTEAGSSAEAIQIRGENLHKLEELPKSSREEILLRKFRYDYDVEMATPRPSRSRGTQSLCFGECDKMGIRSTRHLGA